MTEIRKKQKKEGLTREIPGVKPHSLQTKNIHNMKDISKYERHKMSAEYCKTSE
jgi:hypothetical protein